jgi:hypothetical protein
MMVSCAPSGTFCFVFYSTLEDLFWLFDPNVSCSLPSFDLESPAFVLDVFMDVEKFVEVRVLQRDVLMIFRFPDDPFVRLIEVIHYVCPVFFTHRVPHHTLGCSGNWNT